MVSSGLLRRVAEPHGVTTQKTPFFIHRLVFYLKHDVSETGFCISHQAETTKLVDPTDRACVSPDLETRSAYCAQLGRFHLKTEI
jgi:hypothetical protein